MTIKKQSEAIIPTALGDFKMIAFADTKDNQMPHIVMMHPELTDRQNVIVRVHSECFTGDLFHSKRCECGEQLAKSLEIISQQKGVLIYLRQEGRGIGLINKLKAYQLQDQGLNTVDANIHLGFESDARDYEVASIIIKDLGIESIKLLTNNPAKVTGISEYGVKITERLPIIIKAKKENADYLKTKENLMGHIFQ